MRKNIFLVCLLSIFPALAFASRPSKPKVLTVITHEAPPYMSQSMPSHGAVFFAVSTILKKHGYELKVVFAPSWTRAKIDGLRKKEIDGILPVRTKENEDVLQYSEFNVLSPWMIVERKDKPIKWSKPEDLKGLTAGNFQGVELRPGVQDLIDKKIIRVETTSSIANSLLQLANKRVDFVFMDPFMFNYTMATDPGVEPYAQQLQINPKPWHVEKYGSAFKKNVDPEVVKILSEASAEYGPLMEEYFKNVILQAKIKAKSGKN